MLFKMSLVFEAEDLPDALEKACQNVDYGGEPMPGTLVGEGWEIEPETEA